MDNDPKPITWDDMIDLYNKIMPPLPRYAMSQATWDKMMKHASSEAHEALERGREMGDILITEAPDDSVYIFDPKMFGP